MRHLVAIPVILFAVILQSAVVSRINLLSGAADLPLVMLVAWALQEEVDTAWHWALAAGLFVGFVSAVPMFVPVVSYVVVVFLAQILQRRVWQAPLLAVFLVTFIGTIFLDGLTILTFRVFGVSLSINDALGLITLPGVLLNLLLAIPAYAVMRDLARWVYPSPEVV